MRSWFVAALAAGVFVSAATAQVKRRVAVMDFEYGAVRSAAAAAFGTDIDVGKGICDLLVDKFVNGTTYVVIERKMLDKIMAEQNFSNSDRADAMSAAKIGRVLGVDAIIVGTITQFGRDDKSRDVGGGALSRATGRFGLGGVKVSKAKAVVALTARMINTDTAEIMATATGYGEAERSGTALAGAGGGTLVGGGGVDMRSKNFAETILGEAVLKSVGQLAGNLEQHASRLAAKVIPIDALVADVSGNTLIINAGSRAGVKLGDKLNVSRKVRDVRDPATGKVLRTIANAVGQVVITEVDETSSVGTFTGAGAPKVGDAIKSTQ